MWTLHKLTAAPKTLSAPEPSISTGAETAVADQTRKGQLWEEFSPEELDRWPALSRRNFFCVQRHQATGEHCDAALLLPSASLTSPRRSTRTLNQIIEVG
jgi:hypothetical protein